MKRKPNQFALFLLAAAVLFIPDVVSALTVSGDLTYWDSRTERVSGSAVSGTFDPLDMNRPAGRVYVYLVDQDGSCRDWSAGCSEFDDDVLGAVYSNTSTGAYSFTGIGAGEDVYLMTRYESDDTEVRANGGGYQVSVTETFWNISASTTIDWSITCTDEQFNDLVPGQCDNQDEVDIWFSANERYANILATAVLVDVLVTDSLYHTNGHNDPILLYESSNSGSDCTGAQNLSLNCDEICIASTSWDNNYTVAHEIGHALHKRNMDWCGAISGCVGSYLGNTNVDERCATSEGFADFVAVATHWDDDNQAAAIRRTENQVEGQSRVGNSTLSQCAAINGNPHRAQANAARYFWDLYDSTTQSDSRTVGGTTYPDNTDLTFSTILLTWDEFPAGWFNRQKGETGANGRNIWDYQHYESSALTEIYVNCLEDQDQN